MTTYDLWKTNVPADRESDRYWDWVERAFEGKALDKLAESLADALDDTLRTATGNGLSYSSQQQIAKALAGVLTELDADDQETLARAAVEWDCHDRYTTEAEERETAILEKWGL